MENIYKCSSSILRVRGGGGSVRKITINKADKLAVIEFEETDAVDIVLNKRPIKMLGQSVVVEKFVPVIEMGETLETMQVSGLSEKFMNDAAEITLKDLGQYESVSFKLKATTDARLDIQCDGCRKLPIKGVRYTYDECHQFNLCQNCLLRKKHNPSHKFTKLEVGRYPKDFEHFGVWCKGCFKAPFKGCRFRCIRCRNFVMCSACKKEKPHDPNHAFIKF